MCKFLKNKFDKENLCLAGGVALNCVANGKILKEKIFKNIWIQPAAGDAGGALGASLAYYHLELSGPRENLIDKMQGAYLGPSFNNSEIEKVFNKLGANYKIYTEENLYTYIAKLLSEEKAIGWFQGRMEFGPRALGARSIIADPRSEKMQKNLNLKVKFRESFRPFAPSVLSTHADKFFNIKTDSPYMMLVSDIRENLQIAMNEDQKKCLVLKS